ncbi:hypothetical protein ACIPF8_10495 [Collimonas sp. NPDC087041]|uniref:hypothetical protein n=1 Tax=Collimonas sp. NPDC087041 TaxID=3363960 RepID=UPI003809BDBA
MRPDAIGGYLSLEIPRAGAEYHRDALRYQSSRAAFLALLRAHRPTAVWMPWYICESMLEPLATSGIPIKRYEIDAQLRVKTADLRAGEWLLYVNYFGLCTAQVTDVLKRFPREQVVIDNAQAFFAKPEECLATLYSPRKFVGVPDGGYLITRQAIATPDQIDHGSLQRSSHLLKRIDMDAEAGYADYAAAEESLKLQEPRVMSKLTQRVLESLDYAEVGARRIANFSYLHDRLGSSNARRFEFDNGDVPLCYPYVGAPIGLRAKLAAHRIYTPCYWPEVANSELVPEFERQIASNTLFLPCDQRLSNVQLDRIAEQVLDHGIHS